MKDTYQQHFFRDEASAGDFAVCIPYMAGYAHHLTDVTGRRLGLNTSEQT